MPDRLAEIEARVNAATEGPWHADLAWVQVSADQQICEGYDDEQGLDDVLFIAAARSDVPWLLARVRELERDYALANACIDALEIALFGDLEGRSRDTLEARAAVGQDVPATTKEDA